MKNTNRGALGIIIAIIIVLALAGGAYWYQKNKASVSLTSTSTPATTTVQTTQNTQLGGETAKPDISGWKTYTGMGLTFKYPANFIIQTGGNNRSYVDVTIGEPGGGVKSNIPQSRIKITEGDADWPVGQVLDQSFLITWTKQRYSNIWSSYTKVNDGVKISGLDTLHFHYKGNVQSYDSDTYFFATGQELYRIDFLHIIDPQDWTMYDQFLASIKVTP